MTLLRAYALNRCFAHFAWFARFLQFACFSYIARIARIVHIAHIACIARIAHIACVARFARPAKHQTPSRHLKAGKTNYGDARTQGWTNKYTSWAAVAAENLTHSYHYNWNMSTWLYYVRWCQYFDNWYISCHHIVHCYVPHVATFSENTSKNLIWCWHLPLYGLEYCVQHCYNKGVVIVHSRTSQNDWHDIPEAVVQWCGFYPGCGTS